MPADFLKKVHRLQLEEKILNAGSLIAAVCVFFPWVSGEWLGGKHVTYSGLGFFTSFIGLGVLLLHAYLLLITIVPLSGGPAIIHKNNKDGMRLLTAILTSVLTIAAWSVLTKFTFEFRLQVSFGLYGTLIGSLISSLYAFLLFQDGRKRHIEEFFHKEEAKPEMHVPPPQHEPEDHRFH